MRTARLRALAVAAAAALALAACGQPEEEAGTGGDTIRLGAIFPLSGPSAINGQASHLGAVIATDLVNQQGGACGKQVELVDQDAPDGNAATNAANRLIDDEQVPVLITDTSTLALAVAPVAERGRTVMWETEGITDAITGQGFQWVFRPTFSATQMVDGMVAYLVGEIAPALGKAPGDLSVALINEDGGFGTSTAKNVERALQAEGIDLQLNESYSAKSTDLAPLILKLKDLDPDVLVAASFINDAILFHRQSESLGYEPKVVLGTTAGQGTPDYHEAVGKDAERAVIGGIPAKVDPANVPAEAKDLYDQVVAEYQERSGKQGIDVNVLNGFNSTYTLLHDVLPGACDEGVTAAAVRDAALAVDLPLGSTILGHGVQFAGPDEPNAGQNLRAFAAIMQWQDGTLEVIAPERIATAEANLDLGG